MWMNLNGTQLSENDKNSFDCGLTHKKDFFLCCIELIFLHLVDQSFLLALHGFAVTDITDVSDMTLRSSQVNIGPGGLSC